MLGKDLCLARRIAGEVLGEDGLAGAAVTMIHDADLVDLVQVYGDLQPLPLPDPPDPLHVRRPVAPPPGRITEHLVTFLRSTLRNRRNTRRNRQPRRRMCP